jgi:hypothetical protein
MIDATGWAERLKLAMYARMEELSFRSAVATAAGVLAITGLGVTLTVTTSGGQHEVTMPLGSAVVGAAPSAVPSSAAPSPAALFPPSAEPAPSVIPVSASPQARRAPVRQASSPATVTASPPSLLGSPAATYTAPSRTGRSQPRLAPRPARPGWPAMSRERRPVLQHPAGGAARGFAARGRR